MALVGYRVFSLEVLPSQSPPPACPLGYVYVGASDQKERISFQEP